MGPGEWHDPQDPEAYRKWGGTPLHPPLRRDDDDELAAEQAVAVLAGDTPGMTAYPVSRSYVQAHIEGLPGGGSRTITRRTWRELLGKVTEAIRAPD